MQLKPAMTPLLDWNIEVFIDEYGGEYVGEFPISWDSTIPCKLFYQATVPDEVYKRVQNPKDVSNYYAIYQRPVEGMLMICNGLEVANRQRTGIITPKGNFIYSRHRHDMVVMDDCMVDGGDSYFKWSAAPYSRIVDFIIHEGILIEDTLNKELDERMDFINKLTYKD